MSMTKHVIAFLLTIVILHNKMKTSSYVAENTYKFVGKQDYQYF